VAPSLFFSRSVDGPSKKEDWDLGVLLFDRKAEASFTRKRGLPDLFRVHQSGKLSILWEMADVESKNPAEEDGGDEGNEDVEAEAQVEFKPLIEVSLI
jgi:hypothetical protein